MKVEETLIGAIVLDAVDVAVIVTDEVPGIAVAVANSLAHGASHAYKNFMDKQEFAEIIKESEGAERFRNGMRKFSKHTKEFVKDLLKEQD